MKWTALLLACALLACGQGPKKAFAPPDGNWWRSATQPQRDGFFVGWFHCHDRIPGADWPVAIANFQIEEKIGAYYSAHADQGNLPVTTVIGQLYAHWRKTGAYHFERADPNNEWDGEFWWSNVDGRTGLVLGFLSCQAAAGQKVSNSPVPALVAWIDHWYGVDPAGRDSDMQGPRMNEKLSTAILAAERANP